MFRPKQAEGALKQRSPRTSTKSATLEKNKPLVAAIGGIKFILLPFLRDKETSINGETLRKRAGELNIQCDVDEGRHILRHQMDIPKEWNAHKLLFPAWDTIYAPVFIAYLILLGGDWERSWALLDDDFRDNDYHSYRIVARYDTYIWKQKHPCS